MSIGQRNARIDLLRGVAILLVLLHHFTIAYPLSGTHLAGWLGAGTLRAVFRNGNYGVTIFFVISGYLITSNATRRWDDLAGIRLREFYRLRAARILPSLLLLLAVADGLAAVGVPQFRNRPDSAIPLWETDLAALTLWMNVLTAHADWPNYALCVLWSLSVEEVFYLAFPLFGRLRQPLFLLVLAALIVTGPLWRAGHADDEGQFLYGYLACFDAIALGCAAALLRKRLVPLARRRGVAAGVALAMAALYLCASIGRTHVLGMTAMASGTAVLLLAAPEARHRRNAGLEWLGRHSYELYLFHLVALGLIRFRLPAATHPGDARLVLLAIYLATASLLSWMVARLWSEPLNNTLRRRVVKRPVTITA